MAASKTVTVTIQDTKFTIPKSITDDWELTEAFAELRSPDVPEEDQVMPIVTVARRMFGTQYNKLKELCREEDGHVSTAKINEAIGKVFEAFPKSSSSPTA